MPSRLVPATISFPKKVVSFSGICFVPYLIYYCEPGNHKQLEINPPVPQAGSAMVFIGWG